MIGVSRIGIYIPDRKVDNVTKLDKHGVTMAFLDKKIGIRSVARKEATETASDLCVRAFQDLLTQNVNIDPNRIDFVCVCTQNGDFRLPQTSAVVHTKLNLPVKCASFDISLGCSGYVYALLVAKSFMEANRLECGIVFTADPYSEIIDPDDKNTDLIFGDAATATLLTKDPTLEIGVGTFGTWGEDYEALIVQKNEKLFMDGRNIFNFVLRNVPQNIQECLYANDVIMEDVDLFVLHQASKFIIDNLAKMMKIKANKVPFTIQNFGNTVSSSLPIILKEYIGNTKIQTFLLSGFGVGLSVASLVLWRRQK